MKNYLLDLQNKLMIKEKSQLRERRDYISAENVANLEEAEKNLKRCGIKTPSAMYRVPQWQYMREYFTHHIINAYSREVFDSLLISVIGIQCVKIGALLGLGKVTSSFLESEDVHEYLGREYTSSVILYKCDTITKVYANSYHLNQYKYVTEYYLNGKHIITLEHIR